MILSVKKTDRLFFDTFEAMAAGAAEAALILEEMFRNGTAESAASYGGRIKGIRHPRHGLMPRRGETLHPTFIPPIRPGDSPDPRARRADMGDLMRPGPTPAL